MIKHTFYAVTLGLVLFFLYLMQYTGAFKSVDVAIDDRGPYIILYKNYTGPYHKIVSTIEDVEKWARSQNLKCRLSFGEYFDNPEVVEEGRLKSRGGCLFSEIDFEDLKSIDLLKNSLPQDFKVERLEKRKSAVALFTGAPGIGPLKVYPKLNEFISENRAKKNGAILEIYEVLDPKSVQTTYVWPIEL